MVKREKGRVRIIIINLIRILLAIAFIGAFRNGRTLVMIIAVFGFIASFLPKFLEKNFKVNPPAAFEVMTLFFLYGALFLAEVRGIFAEFWWWDILLNLVAAVALGFIGLTIMYALYRTRKINASPLFVSFFAFTFAVAIGALWEIFEFTMDYYFGFNLQKSGLKDTMGDLLVNVIGALLVSGIGYFYIKEGKISFISKMLSGFIEKNPRIFKSKDNLERSSEEIYRIIRKGESEKLEFKSTIRTNLHTNQRDKKIDHAILKTIVAYLNTNGGTLLVGVSDGGRILGLEKDNFPDNDALSLYFTKMVKYHIGNQYLPYIQFELFPIDDKHVLKVECQKSDKHVFLKFNGEEEFFVRNGPSTSKLRGNALIDYIDYKFKRD